MRQLVQSYVNTIGYPETLSEFREMVEHRWFASRSVEHALNTDEFFVRQEVESNGSENRSIPMWGEKLDSWTAPPWATIGDVSFFYHTLGAAKKARTIHRLLDCSSQLISSISKQRAKSPGHLHRAILSGIAARGYLFAERFHGTIFAVGFVDSGPEKHRTSPKHHWASNVYVDYDCVHFLPNPLKYSDFKDIISISQRTITRLTKSQFDIVARRITDLNPTFERLTSVEHRDTPIAEMVRANGWRAVVGQSAPLFAFEAQVREWLIDGFLQCVIDRNTQVLKEEPTRKTGALLGYADYVVRIGDQLIAIEAKLAIMDSSELREQLSKYCSATTKFGTLADFCLLIDAHRLLVYNNAAQSPAGKLIEIVRFQELALRSDADIHATIRTGIENARKLI